MTTETKVREQYNQVAETYDTRWHSYVSSTLSYLKSWMNLRGEETVLDIACGTGELEKMLIAEHPELKITGIDISEKMLFVAREKLADYKSVTFREGSAMNLPFPDNSFDVVVTANAFHYFNDPIKSLAEVRRVLRPNGKVFIIDWCRDYFLCFLCDLILKWFDSAHKVCYNQQELRDFLCEANFVIEAEQKVRLQVFWGMMVATGVRISN